MCSKKEKKLKNRIEPEKNKHEKERTRYGAQAALHGGMKTVINAIPDNWPMALHLAEGSLHTVQTWYAYQGYRILNGMEEKKVLQPMPGKDLVYTGHYIDHELVSNIEVDCAARKARKQAGKPMRFLLTIGGAGAQTESFVTEALTGEVEGIHGFYHANIFEAVYCTNLLMRSCDVLVTKPSELSFYPVPKLFIKRVGGHERWGAIHAAHIGDGTLECEDIPHTLQMLQMFLEDENYLPMMCDSIERNKKAGVYDGAYKVVELAMKRKGQNR